MKAGLILGGVVLGGVTLTGCLRVDDADRRAESIPVAAAAAPAAMDNRVDSDACRLTRGTDAYAYCFGADPHRDRHKAREALRQVRQCALDAIAQVNRITQDLIDEDDVIEVLCGMAGHYPESAENGVPMDLNTGMQTLVNDYVWK